MANNIFCIDCGFELPANAKFCKKCGIEIDISESSAELKPKIESKKIKPNKPKSESGFNLLDIVKTYFHGNFPLVKSFWMIALPINFVTGIVSRIFPYALIVTIPILILIFIGLWRSADNYIKNKKKKENKFWGYFVKGQIVLAVILISLSVVFGFILGLSEESESAEVTTNDSFDSYNHVTTLTGEGNSSSEYFHIQGGDVKILSSATPEYARGKHTLTIEIVAAKTEGRSSLCKFTYNYNKNARVIEDCDIIPSMYYLDVEDSGDEGGIGAFHDKGSKWVIQIYDKE